MNRRLQDIIKYKTGGRQTAFAALLNWSPQYLSKLLKGVDFGLQPVVSIIEALPEINARWFLTGQGEMLSDEKQADLRREALEHVFQVMELERFIPVMTPDELRMFEHWQDYVKLYLKRPVPISVPTRFNHGGNALISGREKLTPNLQPQPLNQMNYADRRQPKGSTPFF